MRLSYGELHTQIKKACVGVNLPIGLAEEIGLYSRFAAERNIKCVEPLLKAIKHYHRGYSSRYQVKQAVLGEFLSVEKTKPLSSLYTVTAACDLLVFNFQQSSLPECSLKIALRDLDVPMVLIIAALKYSNILKGNFNIHWEAKGAEQIKGVCESGQLIIPIRSYEWLLSDINSSMILRINEKGDHQLDGEVYKINDNELDVNKSLWDEINLFSSLTLVEASQESRLKGAGAGVIDRD